jgi:phospholipid/cholesterol/gamma-HCH transport system substrate-binding protein
MHTETRAYRTAATAAGVVFIVVAAIFLVQVFIAALGMRLVPPIHAPYKLGADFPDAVGVRVGQQVLVNGAVVGLVQGVDVQEGHAHVRMEFDGGRGPVHQGVTVTITPTSSVGHPVVAITDPGLGALLPSDSTVDLSHTTTPVYVDDIVSSMTADPRAGFQTIMRELGRSVDGRGQDIRAVTTDTRAFLAGLTPISQQLSTDSDRMASILEHSHAVMGQLADSHLDALIGDAGRFGATVAAQSPHLGPTLDSAIADLTTLNQSFAGNEPSAMASLSKLPPALSQLNQTLTDFRPLFEKGILPAQADIDQLIVELRDSFARTTANGLEYWKVQFGGGERLLLGGPAGAGGPGGGSPFSSGGGGPSRPDTLFSVLFGG